MNEEQKRAYEWAKKQQFHSVAAENARTLAGLVDELTEQNQHNLNCYVEEHEILKKYRELGTVEELERALIDATL